VDFHNKLLQWLYSNKVA